MEPKYIIGIDPDMANCSATVIDPTGTGMAAYLDKASRGKKKVKYTQQEKLTIASKHILGVAHLIEDLEIRRDCLDVFIEHQSAAHAQRAKKIKWQDLINLAHVSGIWTGALAATLEILPDNIHIIYASNWKQQQSKWVNQRRTLDSLKMPWKKMGGKDPYPVPTDKAQIKALFRFSKNQPNDMDFKDINDSMGIALWAFNNQIKALRRQRND